MSNIIPIIWEWKISAISKAFELFKNFELMKTTIYKYMLINRMKKTLTKMLFPSDIKRKRTN